MHGRSDFSQKLTVVNIIFWFCRLSINFSFRFLWACHFDPFHSIVSLGVEQGNLAFDQP